MKRPPMKMALFMLAAGVAVYAFGETVKYAPLENMERNFEMKLLKNQGKQPFQTLSNAPAIYVPGAGVMLTARVNLVYATLESPFLQTTPAEFAALKERLRRSKLEKVPVLEQNMRECLAEAAALSDFDAVPPNEQFAIGVSLFYFPKEDSTGLPRQITMNAPKQKLLNAIRDKVDLKTVIEEQKQ
jgi:hypothetical protein